MPQSATAHARGCGDFLINPRQELGAPTTRNVDVDRGPPRDPLPTCPRYERVHIRANCGVWLITHGRWCRDTRPPTHRTCWGNTCLGRHREHAKRYTATEHTCNAKIRRAQNTPRPGATVTVSSTHKNWCSCIHLSAPSLHRQAIIRNCVMCVTQTIRYPSLFHSVRSRGALQPLEATTPAMPLLERA